MINNLALENNVNDNMQLMVVEEKQNKFLNTILGKAINKAINYGLKKILPDFIEDSVIDIKNAIFKDGIINGIKMAVNKTIDLGKAAVGTITGTFNKISQMENAVQKNGLIDSATKVIDSEIKKIEKNELLPKEVTTAIKSGKSVIKNDLKKSITKELNEQKQILTKVKRYSSEWEKAYKNNDINKMEKIYDKLVNLQKEACPVDEINEIINKIENVNNIVKNKNSFNLSNFELELANKI